MFIEKFKQKFLLGNSLLGNQINTEGMQKGINCLHSLMVEDNSKSLTVSKMAMSEEIKEHKKQLF